MSLPLLDEVRAFVAGLRGELPELFKTLPPPTTPSRPPHPPAGERPLAASRRVGEGVEGEFARRCAHYAPRMGVSYGKVRVKDMKSLWGSCSYRGDLSFNVRLLSAPPEVLDYVVVHELAHLRWRGHGRRFWELVQKHCPEQKDRRRWLRANGARLLQELPGFGAAHGEEPQAAGVAGQVAGQGEVEAA